MSYLRKFTQKFFQATSKNKQDLVHLETKENYPTTGSDSSLNYDQTIDAIIKDRSEHLNPMMSISYRANPLKIKFGKGQFFFEQNGMKTLDCINNVSHIGHCHPYYVDKMEKQLKTLVTNSRFLYDQLLQATHKLLEKFPPQLCVVTFCNSGSQANDLAMQMAEIHTGKKGIICLDGAYHGITKSCLQVSPYKWNQFVKKADHVTVAKSPCTYRGFISNSQNPGLQYSAYLETIIDKNTGAFISELMQSCAGQIIPQKGLYKQVYQKLRKQGIVCIADEVQTGFGRIGENFWAFQYYGIVPDIVTVGKAMGNGFPVSAVVCRKQISESYKKRNIQFFSTYGGNPLAATAVLSVLNVIEKQKLQQNAKDTGKYLREKLQEFRKYQFVGDIRGVGLFQGIDIVKSKQSKEEDGTRAADIIMRMREKGVLVSRDGKKGNVLKIKPPIIFNRENVDQLIESLKKVIAQIESEEV